MRQQLDVLDRESEDPFKWPEIRLQADRSDVLSRIAHDIACEADDAQIFTLQKPQRAAKRKNRFNDTTSSVSKKPHVYAGSCTPKIVADKN